VNRRDAMIPTRNCQKKGEKVTGGHTCTEGDPKRIWKLAVFCKMLKIPLVEASGLWERQRSGGGAQRLRRYLSPGLSFRPEGTKEIQLRKYCLAYKGGKVGCRFWKKQKKKG